MTPEPRDGFNLEALTIRVLAIERWRDVEAWLGAQGLTLGWAPPTRPDETFGALLEARAEGLRSCLYGDSAASCIAVEALLANGQPVSSRVAPRSAAGPDWKHLLLGGRGVTGRISAAVLRVHRLPEAVIPVAYEVSSSSRAIRSLAHLLHRGAIPAVAAIVPSAGGYTLLLTFEGHPALSQARADIAARTCSEVAAEALGEEPVRRWLASVGGEGGTPVSSPLLMQPTLRREGGWSVLAAMLEAVRGRRGVEACVTHVRHAAASMLVYAPEKSEREVAGIAAAIDAAGGVSPSAGPASGAVGAWLVGERPASIPGA